MFALFLGQWIWAGGTLPASVVPGGTPPGRTLPGGIPRGDVSVRALPSDAVNAGVILHDRSAWSSPPPDGVPLPGVSSSGYSTGYEEAAGREVIQQETQLTETEIRAFKEAVRKAAAETESLTADFSQWRHSRYLAKATESRGRLSFQKPGYVLWKYTSPSAYSVLFRENKMYINDAGKKKDVNAGKRLEKLNKLITGSVTGDMFDAPEFTFAFVRSGGKIGVKLLTREASLKKYIREIELTFENNVVSEVKMTEPSQDYTRIVLKNKVLNSRIDPVVFIP